MEYHTSVEVFPFVMYGLKQLHNDRSAEVFPFSYVWTEAVT